MIPWPEEKLEDARVTYSVEVDGRMIVVENVPARVNIETGEQLFSADTVERLREIVRSRRAPRRVFETHVFDFAA
jgi:hypothetical protein